MLKPVLALAVLAGLMACAVPPPLLMQTEVFRNPDAQIASQTNVAAARMDGVWSVRQRFASAIGPQDRMAFVALADGGLRWQFERVDCVADLCERSERHFGLIPAGPGRWRPADPVTAGFDGALWVLWMDFDGRTMALGTPDGRFGLIVDKSATGGGDRIAAARDIMDWFGYDTARLETVLR